VKSERLYQNMVFCEFTERKSRWKRINKPKGYVNYLKEHEKLVHIEQ
jgi:hypothetical protein